MAVAASRIAEDIAVPTYEGNPKHKHPWQPGRRGSLCPKEIGLARAQELLAGSVEIDAVRYATHEGGLSVPASMA